MSAEVAGGTRTGREASLANLRPPVKTGEVLNPRGNNQHTYRANFDNTIEKLLNGKAVNAALLELVPKKVRKLIEALPDDTTIGEAMAYLHVAAGLSGGDRTELLKRVWPAPKQGDDPVDSHTILIVKDFSGGRDGSAPHEIGSNEVKQVSSGQDGED